jgi:hypothetical protein
LFFFSLHSQILGYLNYIKTAPFRISYNSSFHVILQHVLSLLSLPFLRRLSPGNGFQRSRFVSFHVQRLLSSLAVTYLTTNSAVSKLQTVVTALYKSPSHTQTNVLSLHCRCWLTSSSSGSSSTSGLTSSQIGVSLTT